MLGYELDMSKFTPQEMEQVQEQIRFYKANRKLLQYGDQYRLGGNGTEGFITVSKDKNSAIAVVNLTEIHPLAPLQTIRFKGLNPSALYEISVRGGDVLFTASGELLMNGDFPLLNMFDFETVSKNSGCVLSRMYIFKKAKS